MTQTLATRFTVEGGLEIVATAKAVGDSFVASGARSEAALQRVFDKLESEEGVYRRLAAAARDFETRQQAAAAAASKNANFSLASGVRDPSSFKSAQESAEAINQILKEREAAEGLNAELTKAAHALAAAQNEDDIRRVVERLGQEAQLYERIAEAARIMDAQMNAAAAAASKNANFSLASGVRDPSSFKSAQESAEAINQILKEREAAEGLNAELTKAAHALAAAQNEDDIRRVVERLGQEAQLYERIAEAARIMDAQMNAAAAAADRNRIYSLASGVRDPAGFKSAQESAQAFQEYYALSEKQQQQAYALRAAIDPMAAAQERYNLALAKANELYTAGFLKEDEYIKAQKLAQKQLNDFEKSQASTHGLRLSSFQLTNLSYQVNDVITGIMSGQHLSQIAGQQGGQFFQVFQQSEGGFVQGVKAAGLAIGEFLVSPMGLALAGATALGAGFLTVELRAHDMSEEVKDFNATSARLSDGLRYNADDLAHITAQMRGYGASFKDAKGEVLAFMQQGVDPARLAEFGKAAQDTVDALGVKLPDAAKQVATAFTGDYAAVKALDDQLNFLTASEREQIKALFDSGDAQAARSAALDAYAEKMDAAARKSDTTWRVATRAVKQDFDSLFDTLSRSDWLGNFAYSVDVAVDKLGELAKAIPHQLTLDDAKQNYAAAINRFMEDRSAYIAATSDKARALLETRLKADQQSIAARLQDFAQFGTRAGANNGQPSQNDLKDFDNYLGGIQSKSNKILDLQKQRDALQKKIDDPSHGWFKYDNGNLDQDRLLKAKNAIKGLNDQIAQLEKQPGAGHLAALQRQADALKISADEALKLANAYLVSDSAALKQTATQKALTEATRKGADTDLYARLELNKALADAAVGGAQQVAQMRDQIAAQVEVTEAVKNGGLTAAQAAQKIAELTERHKLEAAAALAEGDAKKALLDVIAALNDGYKDSAAAQAALQIAETVQKNDDQIARMRLELSLLNATNEQRAVELAYYDAKKAATDSGASPADAEAAGASAAGVARMNARLQEFTAARALKDQLAEQLDAIVAQGKYIGLNADKRAVEEKIAAQITQWQIEGGQALVDQNSYLLEIIRRNEMANLVVQKRIELHDEIKGLMVNEFDLLGDLIAKGDTQWSDYRQAAIQAIDDILAEAVKLAALNPLKNWLFGTNEPTARTGGGLLSSFLSSLFDSGNYATRAPDNGGVTSLADAYALGTLKTNTVLPAFANGTDNFPGGWAQLHKDEILELPAGSRVNSVTSSRDMIHNLRKATQPAKVISTGPQQVKIDMGDAAGPLADFMATFEKRLNEGLAAVHEQGQEDLRKSLPGMLQTLNGLGEL